MGIPPEFLFFCDMLQCFSKMLIESPSDLNILVESDDDTLSDEIPEHIRLTTEYVSECEPLWK